MLSWGKKPFHFFDPLLAFTRTGAKIVLYFYAYLCGGRAFQDGIETALRGGTGKELAFDLPVDNNYGSQPFKLPYSNIITITLSFALAVTSASWKPWWANNILAVAICVEGITAMPCRTPRYVGAGLVLICLYDVFYSSFKGIDGPLHLIVLQDAGTASGHTHDTL